MELRRPAVAGRFYPGNPGQAKVACESLFTGWPRLERAALAVMCPHAGWIYSGRLAAQTLARVHVPRHVVMLCPNHTGLGPRVSIMPSGKWQLPTGDVLVDRALASAIADEAHEIAGARADKDAHVYEHAIEVLLPLVLHLQPELTICPIVVGNLAPDECDALGRAIARAVDKTTGCRDTLLIASSDMNHFLDEDETQRRDQLALQAVLAGDAHRLLRVVDEKDITMCGARPTAVALAYAKAHGGAIPELVGHTTSAQVSGDYDRVVGYAGVVFPAA
jgi:AmmeMemoRadiSam system protein B